MVAARPELVHGPVAAELAALALICTALASALGGTLPREVAVPCCCTGMLRLLLLSLLLLPPPELAAAGLFLSMRPTAVIAFAAGLLCGTEVSVAPSTALSLLLSEVVMQSLALV